MVIAMGWGVGLGEMREVGNKVQNFSNNKVIIFYSFLHGLFRRKSLYAAPIKE